ncbi:MAG: hypothetical protein ACYCTV_01840 [Leptospirales bacterium]
MNANDQVREEHLDPIMNPGQSSEPSPQPVVTAPFWYLKAVKGVLVGLLLIQVGVMVWGTVETALLAIRAMPYGFLNVLKSLIVNSLLILALLEISRTVVAYFTLGRVKVTFIVDTVLAVFLSEAVVTWFSGESILRAIELLLILLVLMILRIVAIQYQPSRRDTLPEPASGAASLEKLLARIRKKGSQPPRRANDPD